MTPDHLPEDFRQWPRDPWALLGVEQGADAKEIRRAYARLVRRYKPEHHPEEFRLIRSAYEALQGVGLEWQTPLTDWPADPHLESSPGGGRVIVQKGPADPLPPPPLRAPRDRLRDGDRQASAGAFEPVYARLSKEAQDASAGDEHWSRLYWMLSLAPELEPSRLPIDWLILGLRRNVNSSGLAALYRNELEGRPDLVDRFGVEHPLRPEASGTGLEGLLRIRFVAAGRCGKWSLIRSDLERVRGAFRFQAAAWLSLLLAAIDALAWAENAAGMEALQECTRELDSSVDQHLAHLPQLDRCDALLSIAGEWRVVRESLLLASGCRALLTQIPATWREPLPAGQSAFLRALEPWVDRPERLLSDLDLVEQSAPLVMTYLERQLDCLGRSVMSILPDPLAADLACFVVDSLDWRDYRAARLPLLRACLRDGLALDAVQRVLAVVWPDGHYLAGDLALQLANDRPLRTLLKAMRACGH